MQRIILFDGECNFCNQSVQFIIKRDPKGRFKFASQQSGVGASFMREYDIPNEVDSLVLIEGSEAYLQSTAALRICKGLKGFWKFGFVFTLVPKQIRDWAYEILSKNRYDWFGKQEACQLPSPEMKKRFL
ncbi:thiol-disulfide oxidoreductase DCC family protein [Halobacillus sp. Nhm2S1]|uniref:thiol-disulfide oxidoreductase DCC family protein n=1 Tax=Halobacillus sp. Nhm2S1 TaxID=2866716 RepID=UPI001C72DCE5|nr:thiol-disulfide oxidoreductase DCC family protein [Halobacillus sp. Nhm2S1]MBX0358905.1 thiol-disulfide oxidoreductase DCC family protein [Halobacillus sp. Nhm2S1]